MTTTAASNLDIIAELAESLLDDTDGAEAASLVHDRDTNTILLVISNFKKKTIESFLFPFSEDILEEIVNTSEALNEQNDGDFNTNLWVAVRNVLCVHKVIDDRFHD